MDHVTDVNADLDFNATVGCDVMVTLGQGALDFDGTLRRFQRAAELDEERVTDGLDLGAVKAWKNFPQQLAMFFEQREGKLIVALGHRAVAHHVGEHNRGQPSLFVIGAHRQALITLASNGGQEILSS